MDQYSVRNNLVLQFKRDSIDQSPMLAEMLFKRFGRDGDLEFSRRVFFWRGRDTARNGARVGFFFFSLSFFGIVSVIRILV